MSTDPRQLTILSPEEIGALYGLPNFNDDDKRLYFDFSAVELDAMARVYTSSATVRLAQQLADLKAKRRFFVFEPDAVPDDVAYVVRRYFDSREVGALKAYPSLRG